MHLEDGMFFSHRFVNSALHLRLLLLHAGDIEPSLGPTFSDSNKSKRCDATLIVALPQNPQSSHPITKGYSSHCLLLLFRGCCCTTSCNGRHRYQRIAIPMSILPHKDLTQHPSNHVPTSHTGSALTSTAM